MWLGLVCMASSARFGLLSVVGYVCHVFAFLKNNNPGVSYLETQI